MLPCLLYHSRKFFSAIFKRLNDILNRINFRLIKVNLSTTVGTPMPEPRQALNDIPFDQHEMAWRLFSFFPDSACTS